MISFQVKPGLQVSGFTGFQTTGHSYFLNGKYYIVLSNGSEDRDYEISHTRLEKIRIS